MMPIMIVSIIGTVIIAVLSVMTLTEGYAFKHTIDPLDKDIEESEEKE